MSPDVSDEALVLFLGPCTFVGVFLLAARRSTHRKNNIEYRAKYEMGGWKGFFFGIEGDEEEGGGGGLKQRENGKEKEEERNLNGKGRGKAGVGGRGWRLTRDNFAFAGI